MYLPVKAFQPALADQSHRPFFSLDCHETWMTLSGYELYETWLKNSRDLIRIVAKHKNLSTMQQRAISDNFETL